MPIHTVRAVARGVAELLFHVLRVRRSVVLEQLRMAFPEKNDEEILRIAKESYVNICTTFSELFWAPKLELERMVREVRFVNFEVMREAHARGRGVILLTGHYGNWEWIPHYMLHLSGFNGAAIVRPMQNSHVDQLVQSYRCRFGGAVIPMSVAGREGFRWLKSGQVLMILSDQSAPRDSVFVHFLGRPAATFKGPAVFALKTGSPVIMAYSLRRDDGGYDVHWSEIPTENLPSNTEDAIGELTRRHVKALERQIRERPGLWFWHHRRWKHAPDASSMIVPDPAE